MNIFLNLYSSRNWINIEFLHRQWLLNYLLITQIFGEIFKIIFILCLFLLLVHSILLWWHNLLHIINPSNNWQIRQWLPIIKRHASIIIMLHHKCSLWWCLCKPLDPYLWNHCFRRHLNLFFSNIILWLLLHIKQRFWLLLNSIYLYIKLIYFIWYFSFKFSLGSLIYLSRYKLLFWWVVEYFDALLVAFR